MARIVRSKLRLKAASTHCVLECYKNVIDSPQAYPCTRTLSRVLCSPGKISTVPRWNPIVLTPGSLKTCATKASFAELLHSFCSWNLRVHSCSLRLGRTTRKETESCHPAECFVSVLFLMQRQALCTICLVFLIFINKYLLSYFCLLGTVLEVVR